MAFKVADRIQETSTTTGTGTYSLDGAATGFQAFSTLGAGTTTSYFATDDTNWEVGIGTVGTGPATLARTTILASSNSGSAVNWGSGTRRIYCSLPAAMGSPREKALSLSGGRESDSLIGGYLSWSVSGNALTVAVKTWSGSDPSPAEPVYYRIRSATAATGLPEYRELTAATAITINDTALLGTANGIAFRIWAVVFNDGGTDRLAVINCTTTSANVGSGRNVDSIYPLSAWGIASATQEDNSSDSAGVFYSNGASVTSKAYATLGYATWESGLATAGTWSSGPTRVQLFGPGVPLPNTPIQHVRVIKTSAATGNAGAVPEDDSIPQNNEGNQLMDTATITPTSAANAVNVFHHGVYGHDGSGANQVPCSIFRDSAASAVATTGKVHSPASAANHDFEYNVIARLLAGGTSAQDYKVRIGNGANNTFTINGVGGSRYYGGAMCAFTELTEIMG